MTTPEPGGGESVEDVADRLESIRERVEAATEGPWKLWNGWGPLERDGLHRVGRIGPASGGGVERPHHHDVSPDTHPRDITAPKEDLEFVAAARSDVPYLLSLVEEVVDLLDGWERAYPTDIFPEPPERPDKARLVWVDPDTGEQLSETFALGRVSAAMGRFMATALRRALRDAAQEGAE